MIEVDAYRDDPCGTLSIPFWKNKHIRIPDSMRIVHRRDFDEVLLETYADEPYFRLRHDLRDIAPAESGVFSCRTATEEDLPLLVALINRSYTDLSVTFGQMQEYRRTEAFAGDLWVIGYDRQTEIPVGCGIADFDPEAGEGVLEWVQVLPEYRRRGAGQIIVNELLRRMASRADFATVSGRVNNAANPEGLYRRCGFTGDDVWHILTEK